MPIQRPGLAAHSISGSSAHLSCEIASRHGGCVRGTFGCAGCLTLESALAEQGGSNLMWVAHYLSGMAKALMDDAAEGLEANRS
ncbi:DUF3077 domain-containing protein [Pseudomonas sp. p1(2021b)]|uniref:DUF3077 domain-containing protein n=1 Tax=Pseudomonas sp. p1(2021b) TaxID=2874628 RepID=UPI003D2E7C51